MGDSNPNRPRPVNGLSVVKRTSLKPCAFTVPNEETEATLLVQMHLSALNAKSEPEKELGKEFLRVFANEPPQAIEWAFQAWRDKSPYFPAVSDIRSLLKDWRRGERERIELESKMQEKFLLEERSRQGQLVDFAEVVNQMQTIANLETEPTKRERTFRDRMAMQKIGVAAATMNLTDEQIRARREKDRAEIDRYREVQVYREEQGFFS
jgi:hypothetical protein